MSDIYSLSFAQNEADARVAEFKNLFRLVLIVEALLALGLLIFPAAISGLIALPPTISPGLYGAFLLWTVLFQIPGLLNPVHSRPPVVVGILGRYGIGVMFLCLASWLCAIVTLIFALALNVVYHRMVRGVVMSRP